VVRVSSTLVAPLMKRTRAMLGSTVLPATGVTGSVQLTERLMIVLSALVMLSEFVTSYQVPFMSW
jgi:hypothetical protein